ncbi:hypothetical protein [Micromonospora haikouensis]|uniref:hypothetical protein n=1 Tax=Micromonospora haikouensis TaxID=686309 RepID=UPI003D70D62B
MTLESPQSLEAGQPRPAVMVDRPVLETWLRDVFTPMYGALDDFDGEAADVAYLVQVLQDDGEGAGWEQADGVNAIYPTVTADGAVIFTIHVGDRLRLATIPQEDEAFRSPDERNAGGVRLAVHALEVVARLVDEVWQAYQHR